MESEASPAARSTRRAALRDPRVWLAAYVVVLGAIAFWPVPVDRGASGLLASIERVLPWLTYDVIESTANVVLFVPLGILLTLILTRRRWVLPIALAATIAIEVVQAVLLPERTPAVSDVIANLVGAGIGMLATLAVLRRGRRSRGSERAGANR